jgi:Glycosyl hydrolases family 2, TIM barrel domain/Glycosyl hydrolases family 2/Glycosyl hydrolases family 2, sugar binding domain
MTLSMRRATLVLSLLAGLAVAPASAPAGSAPQPPASPAPPAPVALDSGWSFHPDPADIGISSGWSGGPAGTGWQPVTLPSVFDARPLPQLFHGTVGWYALRFSAPATPAGFQWSAYFQQVRRNATIWLNGTQVATHEDPYIPFEVPLAGLRSAALNTLVLRVDNRKGVDPREGWWNWGGIPRPVSLIARGPVVLRDPALLPRVSCSGTGRCGPAAVSLDGWVTNRTGASLAPTLTVTLHAPQGGSATTRTLAVGALAPGATRRVGLRVTVPSPAALWAPDHPSLYAATIQTSVGGRVVQEDRQQVGVRAVTVRDGLLYLNGRRIDLRGASIEEDVPGRGPALTPADMDSIVAELKAVHANATRAQYLLNPALLDRLDRAGIMVWSQAPIYHRDAQLVTAAQQAIALATLRGTVLAARTHPSVLTQSVANELTPVPDSVPGTRAYLLAGAALVRDLDPSVPVSLDLLSYPGYPRESTYTSFDLLGINNYFGWYPGRAGHSTADLAGLRPYLQSVHARYPRQAMVMTEFGAEATIPGPADQKQTYAYQDRYLRDTLGVVGSLPYMSGALYWTLREFAVKPYWDGGAHPAAPRDSIHHKGLISYSGVPKPAWSTAARLFAAAPLYPAAPPAPGPSSLPAVLALLALLLGVGALSALSVWSFVGLRAARRRPPPSGPPALRLRRRERRADTTYA